jgi:hypothetical protein
MKKITLILFALIFISISSCKKEKTNTPSGLIITAYPTTIGSEWKYKRTFTYESNDTNYINFLINESRVVTIEKDSTINGIDVVKYRTTSEEYPKAYSASFKKQTSQGIYTLAYINGTLEASIFRVNSNNSTK